MRDRWLTPQGGWEAAPVHPRPQALEITEVRAAARGPKLGDQVTNLFLKSSPGFFEFSAISGEGTFWGTSGTRKSSAEAGWDSHGRPTYPAQRRQHFPPPADTLVPEELFSKNLRQLQEKVPTHMGVWKSTMEKATASPTPCSPAASPDSFFVVLQLMTMKNRSEMQRLSKEHYDSCPQGQREDTVGIRTRTEEQQ